MNWTGLAAKAWDPSGGDEPQADYAFIRAHGGEGEWGALWTHTLPDGSAIAQHYKREAIDRVEQLLVGQRRYQWIMVLSHLLGPAC